ncbi:MMPL family transporter [Jongsikchunia kroppenstedtii]|uniref:MMPL family transporter n=1 Tax=Jongsikchunia kroppenstedtii TaxID=1121721 RepID=UPI0003A28BF7|nr:MMPL family transporter [Jongsikchunia kroppenstedtii]
MATYLYRIGKWAFRHRFAVAAGWIAALILVGTLAATISKPSSEAFSIPGVSSEKAQNLMKERFPGSKDFGSDTSARYVFQAPAGHTLDEPQYRAAIGDTIANINGLPKVEKFSASGQPDAAGSAVKDPMNPQTQADNARLGQAESARLGEDPAQQRAIADATATISPDRTTAYFEAGFDYKHSADVTKSEQKQIKDAAAPMKSAGMRVEYSGSAISSNDGGGSSEMIGIAVAAIVMIITFGSMIAFGMPIVTALIGVGIGITGVTAMSAFTDISSDTSMLATMIGLAVGIDYSLFILSRYRHEYAVTGNREEAAGRAVGTSGSAVVFAGMTVIIALAALSIVNIPFVTKMGLAAAATVFIAVLIALTMTPALLGILKSKAFAGRIKFLNPPDAGGPEEYAAGKSERDSNGFRWVRTVVKHPVAPLIGGVVLLALLAIPIGGLKLALPNDGTGDPKTTQRQAYDLVGDNFGKGQNGPITLIVDGSGITNPDPAVQNQQRAAAYNKVMDTIRQLPDVAPTADGKTGYVMAAKDSAANAADRGATPIGGQEQFIKAVMSGTAPAATLSTVPVGDTLQINVVPISGPGEKATENLVHAIRASEGALHDQTGVSYGVTGQTPIELDVSSRLSDALIPYLMIVVGLAFVLLMIVFRSVLVPLTAALGFLLSVLAAFGTTVAIFQEGHLGLIGNPQPIVSFLPIMLIGLVFGLAMDYQVFLVTRMREEYVHGADAKTAVVQGFRHGARVVAAAATIMISVFAGFMLQDAVFIKAMGFALAFAVLLDAFVVRMMIIPAVLSLLGDRAWKLPSWLDRILPNVDVEGEKLRKHIEARDAAAAEPELVGSQR